MKPFNIQLGAIVTGSTITFRTQHLCDTGIPWVGMCSLEVPNTSLAEYVVSFVMISEKCMVSWQQINSFDQL